MNRIKGGIDVKTLRLALLLDFPLARNMTMRYRTIKARSLVTLAIAICSCLMASHSAAAEQFDLVITGGRVIDPETGTDKILNLGITNGSITAISERELAAKRVIDANNQVVAPGFIDVHSHTPTLLGQHLSLLDGITTQLDLEAGAYPVSFYGEHYKGGAQLHYGSSVAHFAIRMKVMDDVDQPYLFVGNKPGQFGQDAFTKPANDAQISSMRDLLLDGLDTGGLGIGVLLDYMTSAVQEPELAMIFSVAKERNVPVYIHVRRGLPGDPSGLEEVIEHAKKTGVATFICHITHNAMGRVGDWLAMIDAANQAGANITTETLSYAAGGTFIGADVFQRRDWQAIFDISYEDVQWVATGEWLTKESWDRYSKEQPSGSVNHHYVKEEWIETALKWPGMMVSTDALPALDRDVLTNPNIAGTFGRLFGHYVRERGLLTLMEGVAMSSFNQAKWMQQASPAFAKKGRLQVGADADIVIFDANKIDANADYGSPYRESTGISTVLVSGRVVVSEGRRIEGRYPGKRILAN